MKNLLKLIGITALAAVIVFSMAACGDDGGGGGGGGPETLTYKGKGATSGDVYTLTIRKTAARAFTPVRGDEFELTAGTDKSKGPVDSITGSNFTLKPSNEGAPTFDAAVSGNDLTGLSGTITLTDGRTVNVTETLTPVTTPGTNPGGSGAWTAVSDSKFGDSNIYAIAYGGGKFVAGGASGKMAYSSDGVNWTAVADSKLTAPINAIAYGNNKFVAVGDLGKIATSPDGVNWTAVTTTAFDYDYLSGYIPKIGQADINAIAFGNGIFVAGSGNSGYGGCITATSSDGASWTIVSNSTFGPPTELLVHDVYEPIDAIAWGNNKFVAVGSSGKMATSPDGVTWTAVGDSKFGTSDITAIAYGGGKFVAGGRDSKKMAVSTDGVNWTAVSSTTFGTVLNSVIFAIGWGNGKFVAGDTLGQMATSSDGINWTAVADSTFNYDAIRAIAYGNNKFVAVGRYGKMAYSTGY
jgi:hypothetical protein